MGGSAFLAFSQGSRADGKQRAKHKKAVPNTGGEARCIGISVARSALKPGESTSLMALAHDSAGAILTYEWRAEAGTVVGGGSNVEFHAPHDKTGRFLVTVTVRNPRGISMECSAVIEVVQSAPE
jgi:hypothetical protein